MQYLFFDIECCDGKHICEFGYVLADENFNILQKEVFVINPDKPFNLTGRENQVDLKLFYDEQVYYNSSTFDHFYERIKAILEQPNQIIVGHALQNDIDFLNRACKRYAKERIYFDFFDSQILHSKLCNSNKMISLEKAIETYALKKPEFLHKSDEDAATTMYFVQYICQKNETTLQKLVIEQNHLYYNSKEYGYKNKLCRTLVHMVQGKIVLKKKKKQESLLDFLDIVKPMGEVVENALTDKKLSCSTSYEQEHFQELIVLIQLLANCHCTYHKSVAENDFYIATADEIVILEELRGYKKTKEIPEEQKTSRIYAAFCKEREQTLQILTIDELFKILQIEESYLLDKNQIEKIVEKYADVYIPKRHKDKSLQKFLQKGNTEKMTISVGEMLAMQGVNL